MLCSVLHCSANEYDDVIALREGLHVSLDFFDDIVIPEHALKEPHSFQEACPLRLSN